MSVQGHKCVTLTFPLKTRTNYKYVLSPIDYNPFLQITYLSVTQFEVGII